MRIAGALCLAGLASGALGGNLAGADAHPARTPTHATRSNAHTTRSSAQGASGVRAHARVLTARAASDAGAADDTPTSTTTSTTSTTTTPTDTTPSTPTATTTQPEPTTTSPTGATSTSPSTPPPPPAPSSQSARPTAGVPAAPSAPTFPSLPIEQLDGAPRSTQTACQQAALRIVADARRDNLSAADRRALKLARHLYVLQCVKKAPRSRDTAGVTAADAPRGSVDGVDAATGAVLRNAGGVPLLADPSTSLALPGAAHVGVPNFFIDKFRIPVFLLPIYQAAGIAYGVRWEVLAAINEIETDYGRNLNVSSAGALGWMQFLPQTWKVYGVDANGDGKKDPFNPVDAIFAAARYLKAAGAGTDLRKAIFSYNHADWYVDSVLLRAQMIGGLPSDLIGSLTGLTEGRFPVYAKARYADDVAARHATQIAALDANAALPEGSDARRRGIDIYAAAGSPVIAVQDGTIVSVGTTKRLGRFVRLADAYGNTYTYAHLKKIATRVPVPKAGTQSTASSASEVDLPPADPAPTIAATAGKPMPTPRTLSPTPAAPARAATAPAPAATSATSASPPAAAKERLFAHPARANALLNGGARQLAEQRSSLAAGQTLRSYVAGASGLDPEDIALKALVPGVRVVAGTILGRIGTVSVHESPHLHFEIRPAGRGAPRIDPKPILDGWKLLEATAIYRARGTNVLASTGPGAQDASIGQILLMSKETLARRVLANPRIEIYACGRKDIAAGAIDRRVLATLEFLAAGGLDPTVTSLRCGHSYYTTDGSVSEHSDGGAVDIAKINGIPILGHQGPGSITDLTIRRLLTLQGTMKPHQIISLMTYPDADNTLALPDHADHIHIGFAPPVGPDSAVGAQLAAVLKPSQWVKLIDRLGAIENPTVETKPSPYAVRVPVTRASAAYRGE